jgi:transcriptional regulator with XRE-family HTH domain
LKQRELGERVSVSNLSISLYETGRNKPTLATLIKLAEALGLSTDYLLGLTADPSPYKQGGVEATGLSEG